MVFLDRAFCASEGCVNKCGRKMTDELRLQGVKWFGGEDFPYSISYFCDDFGELLDE